MRNDKRLRGGSLQTGWIRSALHGWLAHSSHSILMTVPKIRSTAMTRCQSQCAFLLPSLKDEAWTRAPHSYVLAQLLDRTGYKDGRLVVNVKGWANSRSFGDWSKSFPNCTMSMRAASMRT